MNTNIQVSLTEEQRDHLKNLIDGKKTFKKIGRGEVKDLVQYFIDALIETNHTEVQPVVKEALNLSGFKFFVKEDEVEFKEFINFSCNDCGCMVSVADNKLKSLPEDETGLGQFWQDAMPKDVELN